MNRIHTKNDFFSDFHFYGNNTHNYDWYGIDFVVKKNLFALNALTEIKSIVYIFHLCSNVDKFI